MNEQKRQSDSIANIIQKFESFQHNTVNIEDMPPRPITAPPKLNGNNKSLVQRFVTFCNVPKSIDAHYVQLFKVIFETQLLIQIHRKDELITKLCEEVCYLNNQIVELNETKDTKFIEDL